MLIDAHLNTSGTETAEQVLRSFDEAQVDHGVLLAPFLGGGYSLRDEDSIPAANDFLAGLVRGHRDRLTGLAIVNPLHASACSELRRAIGERGLTGLKLVPIGWHAYDECAQQVFQVADELGIPVLIHTGIFIDGLSSRYCRPADFEIVRAYPRMRVTLAHLSWPWTDEAIAVGYIDRLNGIAPERAQIRFDISYGAPGSWRPEVLRKALELLGPGMLQFGSDRVLPCSGAHIRVLIDEVRQLLEALGVDANGRERIFGGTAAQWLGLR